MKKLLISAIIVLVATVIMFTAGTIAYFTDGQDDSLVITGDGANLSGEIIEITVPLDGGEPISGPTSMRIVPGSVVKKSVSVENTGTMGMYLRISIDKIFTLSEKNQGKPVEPELVLLNINEEYWELRDGFYYYKSVISKGETTEPLFTEVEFSSQMNNTYTNSSIELKIKAYATQIPAEANSVFDVTSWPSVE